MTTTSVGCDFVDDVVSVGGFVSVGAGVPRSLAAVVWSTKVETAVAAARVRCLDVAARQLVRSLAGYELWLVVANLAVQPDTRVVRHHKLWRALQLRGLEVPFSTKYEQAVDAPGGIRFFGAARLEPMMMGAVHGIMLAEQDSYLACVDAAAVEVVREIVGAGWAPERPYPPRQLVTGLCGRGGLLVVNYGEFDDPIVSVAAIGGGEMVRRVSC